MKNADPLQHFLEPAITPYSNTILTDQSVLKHSNTPQTDSEFNLDTIISSPNQIKYGSRMMRGACDQCLIINQEIRNEVLSGYNCPHSKNIWSISLKKSSKFEINDDNSALVRYFLLSDIGVSKKQVLRSEICVTIIGEYQIDCVTRYLDEKIFFWIEKHQIPKNIPKFFSNMFSRFEIPCRVVIWDKRGNWSTLADDFNYIYIIEPIGLQYKPSCSELKEKNLTNSEVRFVMQRQNFDFNYTQNNVLSDINSGMFSENIFSPKAQNRNKKSEAIKDNSIISNATDEEAENNSSRFQIKMKDVNCNIRNIQNLSLNVENPLKSCILDKPDIDVSKSRIYQEIDKIDFKELMVKTSGSKEYLLEDVHLRMYISGPIASGIMHKTNNGHTIFTKEISEFFVVIQHPPDTDPVEFPSSLRCVVQSPQRGKTKILEAEVPCVKIFKSYGQKCQCWLFQFELNKIKKACDVFNLRNNGVHVQRGNCTGRCFTLLLKTRGSVSQHQFEVAPRRNSRKNMREMMNIDEYNNLTPNSNFDHVTHSACYSKNNKPIIVNSENKPVSRELSPLLSETDETEMVSSHSSNLKHFPVKNVLKRNLNYPIRLLPNKTSTNDLNSQNIKNTNQKLNSKCPLLEDKMTVDMNAKHPVSEPKPYTNGLSPDEKRKFNKNKKLIFNNSNKYLKLSYFKKIPPLLSSKEDEDMINSKKNDNGHLKSPKENKDSQKDNKESSTKNNTNHVKNKKCIPVYVIDDDSYKNVPFFSRESSFRIEEMKCFSNNQMNLKDIKSVLKKDGDYIVLRHKKCGKDLDMNSFALYYIVDQKITEIPFIRTDSGFKLTEKSPVFNSFDSFLKMCVDGANRPIEL